MFLILRKPSDSNSWKLVTACDSLAGAQREVQKYKNKYPDNQFKIEKE